METGKKIGKRDRKCRYCKWFSFSKEEGQKWCAKYSMELGNLGKGRKPVELDWKCSTIKRPDAFELSGFYEIVDNKLRKR